MAQIPNQQNGYPQQVTHAYRSVQIQTADGLELILILYREALDQLSQAKTYLAAGEIQKRIGAIDRAIAMISELQTALDFEKGKEIAISLDRLYGYCLRRLTEANMKQEQQAVDDVIKVLVTLESAWQEVNNRAAADTTKEALYG